MYSLTQFVSDKSFADNACPLLSPFLGLLLVLLFMSVCEFEGLDGAAEGFVFSEKSKKERLRRLSAVGKASSSNGDREMGCDVSDTEDELCSIGPSKRFKLPKKVGYSAANLDESSSRLYVAHSCSLFLIFFLNFLL